MSETYSQILWREGPQASQVSPGGGVVELLNLLHELLLQAPLLLVSLSVCKFHHQRWGTALKQVRDKRHVTHKHRTELKLCIMQGHRHCRFFCRDTHTKKRKGWGHRLGFQNKFEAFNVYIKANTQRKSAMHSWAKPHSKKGHKITPRTICTLPGSWMGLQTSRQ